MTVIQTLATCPPQKKYKKYKKYFAIDFPQIFHNIMIHTNIQFVLIRQSIVGIVYRRLSSPKSVTEILCHYYPNNCLQQCDSGPGNSDGFHRIFREGTGLLVDDILFYHR